MDSFPNDITVDNKHKFNVLYTDYIKKKLRESIYINILENDENDYFDFDSWSKENSVKPNRLNMKEIIDEIIIELRNLGWNCTYSYGNTVLFIYSTKDPPNNCYNHEYL